MTTDINTIKARLIRQEIALRNVADPEAVQAMAERATGFDHDGALVAVDANGVVRTGRGANPTLSLSALLDEMAEKAPALFGAKPATEAAPARNAVVVVDPGKPGFNLTAALVAARSDPHLYSELMDRLAPKPMKFV